MSDAPTRSERFKADMATMRVKTGTASREAPLQALSVVLMVAGVVVAFGGYQASLNVKATPGSNVDLLSSNSIPGVGCDRDRHHRGGRVLVPSVFVGPVSPVLAAAPVLRAADSHRGRGGCRPE